MAYETGTVSDSHSLVTALRTFLLAAGWTDQASLNGYDYVFHSDGTSGDDDIYIRVAAGLSDAVSKIGDIQHPYTDGFTGFINLFAYQYFPSNGTTGADGSNEIGKFGPVLYVTEDLNSVTVPSYINEYNIAKSTDTTSRRRKIVDLLGNVNPITSAFDGKRFLYQQTTGADAINKVDLYDNSVANKTEIAVSTSYSPTPNYVRLEDGTEYIYQTSSTGGAGSVLYRYDIAANTWKYSGFANDPSWGTGQINSGSSCVGPRRTRTADNYWLYMFRGNATTDWTRFDINSETWSTAMTPAAPWAVGSANTTWKSFCLFVTKEQSGYTYDRIYLWRGNGLTNFSSIAIGEDGDVPVGEVWETHQSTPFNQFSGLNAVCIDGKIIGSGSAKAIFEFELPVVPSGLSQWDSATVTWFETDHANNPNVFDLHYHLAGRVRVTESTTNTYWAFADKDRFVIVVKNDWGEYEYGYVGKFLSYSNPLTNGNLLDTVAAGSNTINVSNPTFFEVDRIYTIIDTTGLNSSDVTSDFAGITRKLSPSETFTVLNSDPGGTLTITELVSGYTVGSRVGEDPVPIMVRAAGSDKALTFDTINLVDPEGYKDPAWQYYRLIPMVSDSLANSTDLSERSLETFVYSISVINSGDAFVGKEVRGQLIGVYAVGTGVASEAEVSVGSSTYIAFDIADSGQTQRIVVGPK